MLESPGAVENRALPGCRPGPAPATVDGKEWERSGRVHPIARRTEKPEGLAGKRV